MAIEIATYCLLAVAGYALIGVLFAFPFVFVGVRRVDPVAGDGTPGFRAMIFPGTVALWPLLLKRWVAGSDSPPMERGAHRQTAGERTGKGNA